MSGMIIRPLLAQTPEANPPVGWRILLVPVLMAVVGILVATTAAISGQDMRRDRETLQRDKDLFYWENELAQAKLRQEDEATIKEIFATLKRVEDIRVSSYAEYGRHFAEWDGYRYEEIAEDGYRYHQTNDQEEVKRDSLITSPVTGERQLKNVPWFPLYPLLARGVVKVSGLRAVTALTVVSETCIVLAAVMLFIFSRRHFYNHRMALAGANGQAKGQWEMQPEDSAAIWVVAALLYGPCSVFLYANFTESLFTLLLVTFLYFLQSRWWWQAALVAGLATACRSQGALLGPILALSYLLRSREGHVLAKLGMAGVLGVISGVGLACYMLYLQLTFGDPIAFMHAQGAWNVGLNASTFKHAVNPINAVANLARYALHYHNGEFHPGVMDWPRVWEALCVIWPPVLLIWYGRRYLTLELQLTGWLMWAMPYVANGLAGNPLGDTPWMSIGRYLVVLVPAQIIAGGLAERHRWLRVPFFAAWAAVFGVFAFKFGTGAWVG